MLRAVDGADRRLERRQRPVEIVLQRGEFATQIGNARGQIAGGELFERGTEFLDHPALGLGGALCLAHVGLALRIQLLALTHHLGIRVELLARGITEFGQGPRHNPDLVAFLGMRNRGSDIPCLQLADAPVDIGQRPSNKLAHGKQQDGDRDDQHRNLGCHCLEGKIPRRLCDIVCRPDSLDLPQRHAILAGGQRRRNDNRSIPLLDNGLLHFTGIGVQHLRQGRVGRFRARPDINLVAGLVEGREPDKSELRIILENFVGRADRLGLAPLHAACGLSADLGGVLDPVAFGHRHLACAGHLRDRETGDDKSKQIDQNDGNRDFLRDASR